MRAIKESIGDICWPAIGAQIIAHFLPVLDDSVTDI